MVLAGLVLASLFAAALGNPLARRALKVHETMELPEGFKAAGPASPDTVLNLRVALTQSNRDGLINALMDVSEPTSALYGQHLTKEEVSCVVRLLRPPPLRHGGVY